MTLLIIAFCIVIRVLAIILCAVVLILAVAAVNKKVRLSTEAQKYPAPGKMVTVSGHKMHVYAQGKGHVTLVFMSGWGTCCPTLDFKPLWSKLSQHHHIAVVEKAGYGWSEVSKSSRDIDTMLYETRDALELSGEKPPYVLVPHSMSGLEALYWAKKYPDEVKAIIGLDSSIPETYEGSKIPSPALLQFLCFVISMGILRFNTKIFKNSAAVKSGFLCERDIDIFRAMFYRSTFTKDMKNEACICISNAQKVKNAGLPDVPMYIFLSDGKEIRKPNWRTLHISYVDKLKTGKYKFLDCGHFVQNYEPTKIAEESEKFLDTVLRAPRA